MVKSKKTKLTTGPVIKYIIKTLKKKPNKDTNKETNKLRYPQAGPIYHVNSVIRCNFFVIIIMRFIFHSCWLSFYKHLSWAFIAPVLLVTLVSSTYASRL